MRDINLAITLYSFSYEYVTGELTFEDCLKAAREMGFTAIELVASQMVPEYPYPSKEWISYFREAVAKHELEPLCYSAYIDMGIRTDRDLTEDEIFQTTLNDMIYAKQLGFKFVRTQHAITPKIFKKMKPYCEKLGVKLAIEMHAPHNPTVPVWREYLDIMKDSEGQLGVVPDFGIFAERPHQLLIDQAIEDFGCRPKKVDLIVKSFEGGYPLTALDGQDLTDVEREFAEEVHSTHSEARLEWLDELVQYSCYMHGKYWYLADESDDSGIPYRKIAQKLHELGYEGYIACEYEGHHFKEGINTQQQIRRYVRMWQGLATGH